MHNKQNLKSLHAFKREQRLARQVGYLRHVVLHPVSMTLVGVVIILILGVFSYE